MSSINSIDSTEIESVSSSKVYSANYTNYLLFTSLNYVVKYNLFKEPLSTYQSYAHLEKVSSYDIGAYG